MLHIWSFDPGKITGWCHLSVHDDREIGIFNCGESDHIQIGNMLLDNPALKAAVTNPAFETVFVVESFTMAPGRSQQPWSLETIGLLKYFAAYYHISMVTVAPSAHKPLIKDDVIKRAGLWQPTQGGHQMDAARIVLWYLCTQRKVLTECLKPS